MRRITVTLLALTIIAGSMMGCNTEKKAKQVVKDPVHQVVVDLLTAIKEKRFDDAFAMYDEATRTAWKKEDFIEWAKDKPTRFGEYYLVKKINKNVEAAEADVVTELTGKYESWNSMPSAKFNPILKFINGKWLMHNPEKVAEWEQAEADRKAREARIAKLKDKIIITEWTVKNEIIDNAPYLSFSGEIENKSDHELDFVRLEVQFMGPDGKPTKLCIDNKKQLGCIDRLHVFPVYINAAKEMTSLKAGEKRKFVETIASDIPLKWTGATTRIVYDAGKQHEIRQK